jgi:DNA-directed RNA polymerase subunit RPC12/RpoP
VTEHRRLHVIPEPVPNTRAVLTKHDEADRDRLFFEGHEADLSYDCGTCGAPLAVGVRPGQLSNLVLQCSDCKSFNETYE